MSHQPDEVYDLGPQSHLAVSFEAPEYTTGEWRGSILGYRESVHVHSGRAGALPGESRCNSAGAY